MPDTIRFVTDHNVDRFMNLLEQAGNESDRSLFKRLLVAEVDRYALEEHRRDALHRTIAVCNTKIERQSKLLDQLRAKGNGVDLTQAEALLNNLLLIRQTLDDYKLHQSNGE